MSRIRDIANILSANTALATEKAINLIKMRGIFISNIMVYFRI